MMEIETILRKIYLEKIFGNPTIKNNTKYPPPSIIISGWAKLITLAKPYAKLYPIQIIFVRKMISPGDNFSGSYNVGTCTYDNIRTVSSSSRHSPVSGTFKSGGIGTPA